VLRNEKESKEMFPGVLGKGVIAGAGLWVKIAFLSSVADPAPDREAVVTGVVRKDGSWYLLSAGGRNYVLVPGRCDSESARKTIESHVGKTLTALGDVDGSKLRVTEIKN